MESQPHNNSTFKDKVNQQMRHSVVLKFVTVGILVLLLLIPNYMVTTLIDERQMRSAEAVNEVGSTWSTSQTLAGPVLGVPYKRVEKIENENMKAEYREVIDYAWFTPETLEYAGQLNPEKRYRGIYEVMVYSSLFDIKGSFRAPDFSVWDIDTADILWDKAAVYMGITDVRGVKENIEVQWNKQKIIFLPSGDTSTPLGQVVVAPVEMTSSDSRDNSTFEFSYSLNINGSQQIMFAPLGKETRVSLKSDWPNPSFRGAFLPDDKKVEATGFTAFWKVLQLNRNIPASWLGNSVSLSEHQFGLDLYVPVDHYTKTSRSSKYAIMLLALTFIVFLFTEVLNKKRIHIIQYTLVGLALIVFFILLLSFSEHVGFNLAYLIASVATIGLITMYVSAVFRDRKLTAIMSGILFLLYGFIFVILQLVDYSLLIGSIGLFVVLALIMYISRNVDWYRGDSASQA